MKKYEMSMEFKLGRGCIVHKKFADAILQLRRPYIPISEEEYEKIVKLTKKKRPVTDYIIFPDGSRYTFGTTGTGYALMLVMKDKDGEYFDCNEDY